MRIEPRAFLAIERSMIAAMAGEWGRISESALKQLRPLVDKGDWAGAEHLANKLSLKGVVSKVRPKLEELCVSALLFGAHRVAGSVQSTSFMKGKKVPAGLHRALLQLEHAVEHDASDLIRKALHAKIADLKHQDERAHFQKDDLSDAQLAESGGLQSPEQGGATTLYVKRELLNAADVIAWAKDQGFETCLTPDDMHVTVCYSKAPVDWGKFTPDKRELRVDGGKRGLQRFDDAIVLKFWSNVLDERHQEFMDGGGSHDYDEYRPHVTISYGKLDESKLSDAYDGPLMFGPEIFAPVKKGWANDIVEKADIDLIEQLNHAVQNGGKVAIDIGAALTTSRLVTLGFLSEAQDTGVEEYEVDEVLDDRTCPVCEQMNGRRFKTASQFSRVMQALACDDPQDLKEIAPWPDESDIAGLDNDELQANGFGSPPYHPGCYVEGTKVYTRRGFIEFKDVDLAADEFWSLDPVTRVPSWVKAVDKQVYSHTGDVFRVGTGWGTTAMVVTPDHTMLFDRRVDRATSGRVFELRFGALPIMAQSPENWLLKTAKNTASDPEHIEFGHRRLKVVPFVRLLAYFLSEGNVHKRDRNWVVIAQEKYKERMAADARAAGFTVAYWGDDKLAIKSTKLRRDWSVFGKAHEKFVPEWVKQLSPETILEFLDAYAIGDGSTQHRSSLGFESDSRTIYTSSIRMRDDLVELALRAGKAASFRLDSKAGTVSHHANGDYASNHDCWVVSILNSTRRKPKLTIEAYDGLVYDVTLERNHTLLIAYEGTVTWGSNCRGMLSLVSEAPEQSAAPAESGAEDDQTDDEADAPDSGDQPDKWDPAAIEQLGWDRYSVTDPATFAEIDDAFNAGSYDEAQALIDEWSGKVEKFDADEPRDEHGRWTLGAGGTVELKDQFDPVRDHFGDEYATRVTTQNKLSAEELESVRRYQNNSFLMNMGLRGTPIPDALRQFKIGAQPEDVDVIAGVIAHNELREDATLYRGVDNIRKTFGVEGGADLVGRTITDPAFMSTTGQSSRAANYAKYGDGAVIVIDAPKGMPAFSVGAQGSTGAEYETILQRGTSLKVTRFVPGAYTHEGKALDVIFAHPVSIEKADLPAIVITVRNGGKDRFVWGSKDATHKEDEFEGPNQAKKKRRDQTPAGRESDYDDISSDSSSIAFDSGVSNDANAPLDRG